MKLYLVSQVELISNWGYFQISQYYSEDILTTSTFPELFSTLKGSALFSESRAYTYTYGPDVSDLSASAFGRCFWHRVSIDSYKQIGYQQFLSVLTANAEELNEYGLKPRCDEESLYALHKEILPLATKVLPSDATFYIFDPEAKDIGGIGASMWDYFKNAVVYSPKYRQVFRVDMGRD